MCNFAAPDMVGHTGQYEPAVKACTATGIVVHHSPGYNFPGRLEPAVQS